MKLTKDIRENLAITLTAKALSKHGPALGKEVKRINQGLEKAHLEHLARLMPEVPPKRYAELIQSGVVTSTISGADQVYRATEAGESVQVRGEYPGRVYGPKVAEGLAAGLKGALKQHGWSEACDSIDIRWSSHTMRVEFDPKLSRTLPDFRGRSNVRLNLLDHDPQNSLTQETREYLQAVEPLFGAVDALCKKAMNLLLEGIKYHEEVEALLAACSTRKKLEELFPEAAALLPPPAPKRTGLVPAELAASVRQRLKDGVPA